MCRDSHGGDRLAMFHCRGHCVLELCSFVLFIVASIPSFRNGPAATMRRMQHMCYFTINIAASGSNQWLIIGARRHSRQVRFGYIPCNVGAFIVVFIGGKEGYFWASNKRHVYSFWDIEL